MKPGIGLLILGAVSVATAIFITLNYALNIRSIWAPFLFLTYWGSVEQLNFRKLPACIVGAVVGLAVSYGLQALPAMMGPAGMAVVLLIIVAMVYFVIMGWLTIAVNPMSLLFLTVATIPVVQEHEAFPKLFAALAVGIVYFSGLAWVAQRFTQPRSAKQPL
jgi:amino acid transporter